MLRFEVLTADHDVSGFRSGSAGLDDYLQRDALRETNQDIDRTFVALMEVEGVTQIVGYFTLSTTYQFFATEPGAEANNVYLAQLSCLARHEAFRGQGMGDALLLRALYHIAHAANYLALAGVWLTATTEGVSLYERFEFTRLYPDRREFFMPIQDVRANASLIEPEPLPRSF